MGYLPLFLDVSGRPCMVVGGGAVAARKAAALLDAGARVTVVSPRLCAPLARLSREGGLSHIAREYRRGDMRGSLLVYAATDDAGLHRELAAEARELAILLNVADQPELCSFTAPAVISRGALKIAISTGGASPALAARLRRELEERIGAEYGAALQILRAARRHLRAAGLDSASRAARLRALADSELPRLLVSGDAAAIDALLIRHLGAGLAALGLIAAELVLPERPDVPRPN
jgi:precorrin-2 dehydrogenase